MTTVLSRETILAALDLQIEWVEVPEWGAEGAGVFVRGLTGADRDAFEMDMIQGKGKKAEINLRNLRAKLVVRSAVDSNDPATAQPIFKIEDIEPLGRKSAAALQRIYGVAQRLSGLSEEDVEELTTALGEGESDGSGSGLPLPSGTVLSRMPKETSAVESSASGSPSTAESPSETVTSTTS